MIEHKFAADHDAIDACAVFGEHDLVQRRVERDVLNGAQIEEDDIGVIAWRKAAECAFEAQGPGASLSRRARSLSKVYPSTICRQRARLSSWEANRIFRTSVSSADGSASIKPGIAS